MSSQLTASSSAGHGRQAVMKGELVDESVRARLAKMTPGRALAAFAVSANLLLPVPGIAQTGSGLTPERYPERAIRLVVPFNAGSATDAVARQVAPKLSEYLGQNLVVDNRGGASGTLAACRTGVDDLSDVDHGNRAEQ